MATTQRTHREVKTPKISARQLADFMAASETARRTIVRDAKYQARARVIQHDEAKVSVSKFIRSGATDPIVLREDARRLRERMADTDFDRDLFDHNADYIDRLAEVCDRLAIPEAERQSPGSVPALDINGVKVTIEISFRLQRITRTNKVKVGGGMLRYAKGKALDPEIAVWQSAFLFGYLGDCTDGTEVLPEHALCLTVDAYAGMCHPAPTDSVRRYKDMKSACASIAERWPNVAPPPKAVL